MERRDFNPELPRIMVDLEIVGLLNDLEVYFYSSTFIFGNKMYKAFRNRETDNNGEPVIKYPYTWIRRSKTDPTRLSGYPFSTLIGAAFNYNGSEADKTQAFEELASVHEPSELERRRKGIHIKPGRLLHAICDRCVGDTERLADSLATALRRTSGVSLGHMKVSSKPSEIYTVNSNFGSCMTCKSSEVFQIYDDLENTSVLYIKEGDVLRGRALLHENVVVLDENNHTTLRRISVMDRIYSESKTIEMQFVQWAVANGYHYKQRQSLGCHDYIFKDNSRPEEFHLALPTHDLRESGYSRVPYIDTFCNYFESELVLSSSYKMNGTHSNCCMQETGGNDDSNFITESNCNCYNCGASVNEDDASYTDGEYYCESCYDEMFSYCDYCENTRDSDGFRRAYNSRGNEIYVCEGCLESDFSYCNSCDDYYYNDNMTNVDGDEAVCNNCLDNFYTQCDECGEYIKNTLILESDGGGYICSSCSQECVECNGHFPYGDLPECGICDDCINSTTCNECNVNTSCRHSIKDDDGEVEEEEEEQLEALIVVEEAPSAEAMLLEEAVSCTLRSLSEPNPASLTVGQMRDAMIGYLRPPLFAQAYTEPPELLEVRVNCRNMRVTGTSILTSSCANNLMWIGGIIRSNVA